MESIMGMAFFGPALILLTLFLFLPMILTLIFSFTDFLALNPGLTHFVGLDNYFQILKDDGTILSIGVFRQSAAICAMIVSQPVPISVHPSASV